MTIPKTTCPTCTYWLSRQGCTKSNYRHHLNCQLWRPKARPIKKKQVIQ